jgi:hypothetical protein
MAINTTTFESTLQTKLNDTTLAAKDMLLLGKALEATSGNIAVSNVTAEGTTQVARVVAAMTGALPEQSGQAGKVLTSDGTDSSWQEGLPSQTGQSAKFLTTDGTSANWEALSSDNLTSDFVVGAGGSVTANTFVSLDNDKIGNNPVANVLGANQTFSGDTSNLITGDGLHIVKGYQGASNHHYVRTTRVSDQTVVSDVAVYTGMTSAGNSIVQVNEQRFVMYGTYRTSTGYTTQYCGSNYGGNGYNTGRYAVMLEVSPTGVVTYGSAHTATNTGDAMNRNIWLNIYPLDHTTNRCGYRYGYSHRPSSCNTSSNTYDTFTTNGSLSIGSAGFQTTDSYITNMAYCIKNSAGNKLIKPSTSTTWKTCSWDGTDVSNGADITNNRTNLSSAEFLKPDPSQDKILCFYINSNLELCVETLDWTSGAVNVVAGTKWIVEADASGITLGKIKGSTAGIGITYENGSKGRFRSMSLDSNMKVTGSSSLMTANSSNFAPGLAYKGNDKFQVWHNNVDTNTAEVTINAYSTYPLQLVGVAKASGSASDTVAVITNGVASGFTGLVAGSKYYYDVTTFTGAVTLTDTGVYVGRAISATEILLTDLTEQ